MGEVLSYAPRTEWSVLRRHRRVIRIALILLLCGTLITYFRMSISRQIPWRQSFQQCMTYQMPTNMRKLPESNGAYSWLVPAIEQDLGTDRDLWNPTPAGWVILRSVDRRTDWVKCSLFLTFLGRMQRPDGEDRLVILGGRSTNALDLANINLLVLASPRLFQVAPQSSYTPAFAYNGHWMEAQLDNAWRDPNDASHLIVPITIDKGDRCYISTLMDGYLQNDDSMKLQLRDDLPGLGRRKYALTGKPSPDLSKQLGKNQASIK